MPKPYDPFESSSGSEFGPDPADPVQQRLRSLRTPGPTMPALPPDHVRRLGDRRRRRRHAGAAAASLAVVAVLAGGGLALSGTWNGDGTPPPPGPATQSADAVRTDIPEGFPLDAGWPADVLDGVEERTAENTALEVCDGEATLEGRDDVAADNSLIAGGEGESMAYNRTLATFDSVDGAAGYVDEVRELAQSCSSFTGEGADLFVDSAEVEADRYATGFEVPPEDAFTVEVTGGDVPITYRLYRVENAVLISTGTGFLELGTDDPGQLINEGLDMDGYVVGAMQYYAGRELPAYSPADPETDDDDGSATTTEPPPPTATVSADQLLTVEDLPANPGRLEPWQEVTPGNDPTLVCESEGLGSLTASDSGYAEFSAALTGAEPVGDERDGSVNSAVLAFESPDDANAAYDTASSWISSCSSPIDGQSVTPATSEVATDLPEGAEGYWYGWTYAAPEYCGGSDCDAARFDLQGAAIVGNYLVLVSYSEIGGPLAPEGMDARMNELFNAAVARAAAGAEG